MTPHDARPVPDPPHRATAEASPEALLFLYAQHPSFTPTLARRLACGLTDHAITLAWQRSCRELTAAIRPAHVMALATLRQILMDEMELRDTRGFEFWLAAQQLGPRRPSALRRMARRVARRP